MRKIALIIGHNQRSQGAYSTILGNEYSYWKEIAYKMKELQPETFDIYERLPNKYYVNEMKLVLQELNKHNYDFCLELHFNSFDDKANGCECLCYYKTTQAQKIITQLLARLQMEYGLRIRSRRGIIQGKEIVTHGIILVENSKTRGGYGICNSKDTYILIEPFFASNPNEAIKFKDTEEFSKFLVKFVNEVDI